MNDYSVPGVYYLVLARQVIPYFGLVLVSVWLFRHARRAAAWMMLVGSVLKACDAFAKEFIFRQSIGLWAIKGVVESPVDARTLRLQQELWTLCDRMGSLGLVLFVIGLLLFAWWYRGSGRSNNRPPATAASPGS